MATGKLGYLLTAQNLTPHGEALHAPREERQEARRGG
jgi:hypothetical protein